MTDKPFVVVDRTKKKHHKKCSSFPALTPSANTEHSMLCATRRTVSTISHAHNISSFYTTIIMRNYLRRKNTSN
jgi:hypothetical protein